MSYEKVKVIGVRQIVKRDTGQVHYFLEVEHLKQHSIYLNDDAVKQLPVYEAHKGKEVLIPAEWGEYQGRPTINLVDDFLPLPAPVRNVPANVLETKESAPSTTVVGGKGLFNKAAS